MRLVWRLLRWVLGTLIGLAILFALSAWIGSSIARNGDWVEPDPRAEPTVELRIASNGIHTEIVMPLINSEKDWRATFPASDLDDPARDYTHVSVGWGERAFFLETPTWAEFELMTGVNAMIGGEGVLHVSHYVRPMVSEDHRTLYLRPAEYRALVAAIQAELASAEDREVLSGYGASDVFYTAPGTYHIANTCNQWTSDRLAEAGVEIGLWSPLPGGVMKWAPESSER